MRPDDYVIDVEITEPTDIGPLDLRREAEQLTADGVEWEAFTATLYEGHTALTTDVTVLFVPSRGRAGIAWGGDADWTDADSVEEALDRYLSGLDIS